MWLALEGYNCERDLRVVAQKRADTAKHGAAQKPLAMAANNHFLGMVLASKVQELSTARGK